MLEEGALLQQHGGGLADAQNTVQHPGAEGEAKLGGRDQRQS